MYLIEYGYMEAFIKNNLFLVLLITIWQLVWSGYALWLAARAQRVWWFVAILIINSLGILEILYVFIFDQSEENIFRADRTNS